jgi:hypothetical protein
MKSNVEVALRPPNTIKPFDQNVEDHILFFHFIFQCFKVVKLVQIAMIQVLGLVEDEEVFVT